MVALSFKDKERVYFHLGYGSRVGIDAGDIARVEQACTEVYSDDLKLRIIHILDIADKTYAQTYLVENTWYDSKDLIVGDSNRSSRRVEPQKQQQIWQAEYSRICRDLAKLLRVTNYNDSNAWQWTHDRNSQAYINIIPGVADTSVASRAIEIKQCASGIGD